MHIERSSLKTENFRGLVQNGRGFYTLGLHERSQSNLSLLNFDLKTDFIVKRLETFYKSSVYILKDIVQLYPNILR